MIRITVDTDEELKIVRDYFVKPSFCDKITKEHCELMLNCEQCTRINGSHYIEVFRRKVIEEPQDL